MKRLLLAAATACAVAAAVSPAQALVIGSADAGGGNSYPFGSSGAGYYYQQIYSASSFSGPLNINKISFYNSQNPTTNHPLTDSFTLFLSTTTAPVSSFDTDAMQYPNGTFTEVFSGTLGDLVDGRLDIDLSSAFNYDPTAGNLVLTVRDFTLGSDGSLFLDSYKNTGVTNMRMYAYGYDFNQGLVTGFNDPAPGGAVPEPATWAMMVAGFGLVGAALRRKSAAVAA